MHSIEFYRKYGDELLKKLKDDNLSDRDKVRCTHLLNIVSSYCVDIRKKCAYYGAFYQNNLKTKKCLLPEIDKEENHSCRFYDSALENKCSFDGNNDSI